MLAGLRLASLELLGLEHRPPEVDEEKRRHGAGYDVVEHVVLLALHASRRASPERPVTTRQSKGYTRSQSFTMAQSAKNPATPIAR